MSMYVSSSPRRAIGLDESSNPASTRRVESIYSRTRHIASLGITLGASNGSGRRRGRGGGLQLGLMHDSSDEDEDEEEAASVLTARTTSRLAREKPWRTTNALAAALEQAQITRPANATRPNVAGRPVPPTARPTTAAAVRTHRMNDPTAAISNVRSTILRPATATRSHRGPRMDALAASIETLRSSTFQATAEIARAAMNDRSSYLSLPSRPSTAAAARPTSANGLPAYAQPTASSAAPSFSHAQAHPRPGSSSGYRPRGSQGPFNPAHGSMTDRRYGGASSSPSPSPTDVAFSSTRHPLPPCVVASFLRLTPPNARARALHQHRELNVIQHDERTVQFMQDEGDRRDEASNRAKAKYQRHLASAPPVLEPDLFTFEKVFAARPARIRPVEQAQEIWHTIKPLLQGFLSTTNSTPAPPSSPICILSLGPRCSGKSSTLFGCTPNEPSLFDRVVHHVFFLASAVSAAAGDRKSNVEIGLSAFVLLPSPSPANPSSQQQKHRAIDLLATEWQRAHSLSGRTIEPVEVGLSFPPSSSDGFFQLEQGVSYPSFRSPQDLCQSLKQARDAWIARVASSGYGSIVVTILLARTDRSISLQGDSTSTVTRSFIRFLEPPACLREWAMSQKNLLALYDGAGRYLPDPTQKEIDDLHRLLQIRARTTSFDQDGAGQDRIECGPNASAFSRLILPSLNPNGVCILLTHLSVRGGYSSGARVAEEIIREFGSVKMGENEHGQSVRVVSTSSSRIASGESKSLLATRSSYRPFLIHRIYPAVQRSVPHLYAPLLDIIMEYAGAGKNLSVRLRQSAAAGTSIPRSNANA